MTNRTVQVQGFAYGANPGEITAIFGGNTVFSGTITTIDAPLPSLPDASLDSAVTELFSFEIPMNLGGQTPMSLSISNAQVLLGPIVANYANRANTQSQPFTYYSSGPTEFRNVYYPPLNVQPRESNEYKLNVQINGVPQTISPEQQGNLTGSWWWTLNHGDTMTFDLLINPGLE